MRRTQSFVVGVAVVALVTSGCVWNFQSLDGTGGSQGQITDYAGYYNSAIVYNGAPHVFSWDEDESELRHSYWNGSFWAFETLDGHQNGPHGQIDASVAGSEISAMLYNGRPHVFYIDATNSDLRHGYYNGQFWAFETLDGAGGANGRIDAQVGRGISTVLYSGRPHVFYYDATNDDLRHSYYNGQFWAFETLDGNGGPNGRTSNDVGEYTSSLLYNGRPHVFNYDSTTGALRHAYWNGQFWAFEVLDGNGGPNGRVVFDVGVDSTAIVYNNRPHVFYRDETDDTLRHGYYNGQFWAFEVLDGNGGPNGRVTANVGRYGSAIVYSSRPRVFYHDFDDDTLRQAYYNGVTWAFEDLDGNGGANGRINGIAGRFVSVVQVGFALDVYYFGIDGPNEVQRQARFG